MTESPCELGEQTRTKLPPVRPNAIEIIVKHLGMNSHQIKDWLLATKDRFCESNACGTR